MMAFVEDIVAGINQECGCYEETCLIWPFEVILHFEPDGTGEAHFYNGDYELEQTFPVKTIDELRTAACNYVDDLFVREEPVCPDCNGTGVYESYSDDLPCHCLQPELHVGEVEK